MTRTLWLASYPKSGNTWFRMLVANLSATDKPIDINGLPERSAIASARAPFDYLTLIESGLLTHDEADRLRPRVYEELKRGAADDDDEYDASGMPAAQPPVRFVKCHDAYTCTSQGEPLLGGAKGADGAIVIVRDPRDVVPSLAHHLKRSIDAAIDFMNDDKASFCGRTDMQPNQLRQQLPDWSGHARTWLDQTDIPIHLVRYEDMQANAAGALRQAIDFAAWPATDQDLARAVAFADFSELKRQEANEGFREAPAPHRDGRFFRRGETGAWRDELTAAQVARIEAAHAPMMQRLGYAVSSAHAAVLARAG